ncbi:unnamed protein product, partial [Prorocentrum cordatum]
QPPPPSSAAALPRGGRRCGAWRCQDRGQRRHHTGCRSRGPAAPLRRPSPRGRGARRGSLAQTPSSGGPGGGRGEGAGAGRPASRRRGDGLRAARLGRAEGARRRHHPGRFRGGGHGRRGLVGAGEA